MQPKVILQTVQQNSEATNVFHVWHLCNSVKHLCKNEVGINFIDLLIAKYRVSNSFFIICINGVVPHLTKPNMMSSYGKTEQNKQLSAFVFLFFSYFISNSHSSICNCPKSCYGRLNKISKHYFHPGITPETPNTIEIFLFVSQHAKC